MSHANRPITDDQIQALPPEFQELLRSIIAHYEGRIAALEAELAGVKKTAENSSLPPSSQHPHAKPVKPKTKSRWGSGYGVMAVGREAGAGTMFLS